MAVVLLLGLGWVTPAQLSAAPPVITRQPVAHVGDVYFATPGAALGLGVTATGATSYQWLRDGTPVAGETRAQLFLTGLKEGTSTVWVVVSNADGSVASDKIQVQVDAGPHVWVSNSTRETFLGADAIFLAGISALPPYTVAWYHDGVQVPDLTATNSSYGLSRIATTNAAGVYSVTVTRGGASASAVFPPMTIRLTPPSNISIVGSNVVNGSSSGAAAVPGTNVVLSARGGFGELAYQWMKDGLSLPSATGPLLSLPSVTGWDAGDYRVIISQYGLAATSGVYRLVVNDPRAPKLTKTLTRTNLPAGITARVGVEATGSPPLTYVWSRVGYLSVPAVTNRLAASGPELLFDPLIAADEGTYSVTVSNAFGFVRSGGVDIMVDRPPAIVAEPKSQAAVLGEALTLLVVADGRFQGNGSLRYQWRKEGVLLPGAREASLVVNPFRETNVGFYDVVVTNGMGAVTSKVAVITATNGFPPAFDLELPASTRVVDRGTLSLTAHASGSNPMVYQWFRNGTSIPSAVQASLNLPVTLLDTGTYTVTASNRAGVATSRTVAVTVVPGDLAVFCGSKFVRVIDPNLKLPTTQQNVGDLGLSQGRIHSGAFGFVGTTRLARNQSKEGVYLLDGAGVARLQDGAAGQIPGSSVVVSNFLGISKPNQGRVAVLGHGGTNAAVFLAGADGPRLLMDTVATPIPGRPGEVLTLLGQPEQVGGKVAFLGGIQDPFLIQSYRGVFLYDGALNVLADSSSVLPGYGRRLDGGSTQCGFDGTTIAFWGFAFTNDVPFDRLHGGWLDGIYRVRAGGPVERVADRDSVIPGRTETFHSFVTPPTVFGERTYFVGHDSATNNILVESSPAGLRTILAPGDPLPVVGPDARVSFVSLGQATSTGVYLQATTVDLRSAILFWDGARLTKVLSTLDLLDGQPVRGLLFNDADECHVLVTALFASGTSALYSNTDALVPFFTTLPADTTAAEGGSAIFSGLATGAPTPAYQWFRDGQPIVGATNSVFRLDRVSPGDAAAQFHLVAQNRAGSRQSPAVRVKVEALPVLVQFPTDTVVEAGSSLTWTVQTAVPLPPAQYFWYRLTNGSLVARPGGTNSLVLTNLQPADSGTYLVRAFSGVAVASSPVFQLTVITNAAQLDSAPVIYNQARDTNIVEGGKLTLFARAHGRAPIVYQWSRDGVPLPGGDRDTFEIPAVAVSDSGTYTVTLRNELGNATSEPMRVLVGRKPVFVQEPRPLTLASGETLSLTALADGGAASVTYQWFRNGIALRSGLNLTNLSIGPVSLEFSGQFRVNAVNFAGQTAGTEFTVTVTEGAPGRLGFRSGEITAADLLTKGFLLPFDPPATGSAVLEYSVDLNHWQRLDLPMAPEVRDPAGKVEPLRFYRLRSVP